ncbi:MAG: phosphomannomutase/phosphoglucomutase [Parvularculales bacterium]
MFPTPRSDLTPNTPAYEVEPLIIPTGFREYDARWLYPDSLNMMGVQALGMGLGTLIKQQIAKPAIVVGHDYRIYSATIKQALIVGLMEVGLEVHDIGLSLSPMAYFAQHDLGVPGLAMVTASHNENGWTGFKMAMEPTVTFGPDDMAQLRDIVLGGKFERTGGGRYHYVEGFNERYLSNLTNRPVLSRRLRVVLDCGNGTAGVFAPPVFDALGADVIPLHCTPDYTFPHYNPNPEDMAMLTSLGKAVRENSADIGLAFDGDGDRCGVVDDKGRAIFADKIGLMLARMLAEQHRHARFVVDIKSTGLFMTDPVLQTRGAQVEYWKTGHSHMKRRMREVGALAGFEKSGHYFPAPPLGYGYDDGILSAIMVCDMVCAAGGEPLSALYSALPTTWASPTISPYCADEKKYQVVEELTQQYQAEASAGKTIAGLPITDIMTINGVRVTLSDGGWGLVRASSNKPCLVVVVESPTSEEAMGTLFDDINTRLARIPDVGSYDQTL